MWRSQRRRIRYPHRDKPHLHILGHRVGAVEQRVTTPVGQGHLTTNTNLSVILTHACQCFGHHRQIRDVDRHQLRRARIVRPVALADLVIMVRLDQDLYLTVLRVFTDIAVVNGVGDGEGLRTAATGYIHAGERLGPLLNCVVPSAANIVN